MPQTPRELVIRSLTFDHPERVPRDLWVLPWADLHHPETVLELSERFPADICTTEYYYPPSQLVRGDPYQAGIFTDEWGCVFKNIQDGIIGEVVDPIIPDIEDLQNLRPPYEQLPPGTPAPYSDIARYYEATDRFVTANCCPRPWERYQFLRGTENAMMDVLMPELGFMRLLSKIHDFYLREWEFWVSAEVDAVRFMDDWGSQNQLLIRPEMWREFFKPIYRDYCELAKSEGKFVFMHSDGYIADIIPDLIEIGVDALNSQLFCMDIPEIGRMFKGKITFWGEIDRQRILTSPDAEDGRAAVRLVGKHLYDRSGGVIAQFEFGAGAEPETALAIFDEWDKIGGR